MTKKSAGILAYRLKPQLEVLLVHPGGPFFKNKDAGVWTIPKGEFDDTEEASAAAKREFLEETGFEIRGELTQLQPIKQKGGKIVYPFAALFDMEADKVVSNTFMMEWPPKSGRQQTFPEVDKAAWFSIEAAQQKINVAQIEILNELVSLLKPPKNKSEQCTIARF